MHRKDAERFAEIMTGLAENFGDRVSKPGLSLRFDALRGYSIQQVEAAAMELLRTRKYTRMPTVADFISCIDGTVEDKAVSAWMKVMTAISSVGNHMSVCFDDPAIHTAIKYMGGWQKIGLWEDSETKWKQKEFEKLYLSASRHTSHEAYLPGQIEIENSCRGFEIPAPVRVSQLPSGQVVTRQLSHKDMEALGAPRQRLLGIVRKAGI